MVPRMSIRIPFKCLLTSHKRDRARVWWDGVDWRSYCVHCDKPMIRHRHNWRLFGPEDQSSDRKVRSAPE